jgi:tetratricopeptide (TPR) repeat protein
VLAQSLRTCGDVEQGAGNPARAKELLIGSQQLYEGLLRARPRVTQYRRSLAMVLSDLASLEKKENNPEASLKALEQAVTLLRELKDQDGESRIDRSQLAGVAHRLGDAYKDRKNFAAAAKAFEEAREQRHFLLSRRPSDTDVRKELAGACLLISHCYGNINKHAEALPASEEAVTQYRIVVQQKPSDGTIRKNLGNALGNKAISLRALGRTAEAITTTEERARMHAGNAESLYDAALDFARTYNAVSAAADPDTKDRALHAAADTLRQALVAGLPNLDRVRTETTFKTIRETDVFKKLMNGED